MFVRFIFFALCVFVVCIVSQNLDENPRACTLMHAPIRTRAYIQSPSKPVDSHGYLPDIDICGIVYVWSLLKVLPEIKHTYFGGVEHSSRQR